MCQLNQKVVLKNFQKIEKGTKKMEKFLCSDTNILNWLKKVEFFFKAKQVGQKEHLMPRTEF